MEFGNYEKCHHWEVHVGRTLPPHLDYEVILLEGDLEDDSIEEIWGWYVYER